MQYVLLAVFAAWLIMGHPKQDVADWFWADTPAPWEQIDAFYYPDRSNLTNVLTKHDVGDLDDCRSWVRLAAAQMDEQLLDGDFECGVGLIEKMSDGTGVYRLTLQ